MLSSMQFYRVKCFLGKLIYAMLPCRLKAESDEKCRLKVEYQLVYVTSVNAFIKKAIERGNRLLTVNAAVAFCSSGFLHQYLHQY